MNLILKRFYHSWSAWIFVFCAITSSLGISILSAQTAIGPEQDCSNALPVVRPIIIQQTPYSGAGVNTGDISSIVGCTGSAEKNSSWYRLVVGATGTLAFTISPLNGTDDYNFIAYRAPAGTTGFSSCLMTSNDASRVVACSFEGGGFTGANTALVAANRNTFRNSIPVTVGDIILISVNNFTGASGFTLDFSASSSGVIPSSSPQPSPTIRVQAVQTQSAAGGCSAPSVINVTFSQPVLRGSIQPSSFVVQSADGTRNFTVTQVACSNCPSENIGTPTFALTLSAPITESGVYRVSTSNTTSAITARDITNAPIVLPASTSFVVNIGNRVPTVQVGTGTALNTRQSAAFCLGQTLRLTAEDAGASAQYQWVRDDGTTLTDLPKQTARTLEVFGRYAGDNSPTNDSTFIQIGQSINYRVRITDGNGCIRLSSSSEVAVNGGLQASITVNGQVFEASQGRREVRICRNDGATMTAQEGFRSYLWYINGRPVAEETKRTLFARDEGLYTVETVDLNGCRNIPAPILLSPVDIVAPQITGPNVNCPDPTTRQITNRVTLTAATDPSYISFQWLDANDNVITGANSNTLSVTTGTFKVRVRTTTCTVTATKTVIAGTVLVPPDIFPRPEGGLISLCPGGVVPLQANSTYFSYKWYRDGIEIPGATQRTYNATVAGLYQVQGIGADGCSTALSPSLKVENTSVPVPTITPAGGTLRFCRGSSIRLSVTNGDNFEWTLNNETIPFSTAREVNVSREGRYSVRVTFNGNQLAGCSVTTSANVITVDNPIPVVLNPATDSLLCQGETRILRADSGYESYQWLRDGTDLPGATMPNLSITTAGAYTVRVTAAGGCAGTSATFRVTVVPAPNIPTIASTNEFLLCPNSSIELAVANVQAGVTYQWFFAGQIVRDSTRSRLVVRERGDYTVEARNANGCISRPISPSRVDTTQRPTPPVLPRTLVICPNSSTSIDAGAGFTTYQWTRNGIDEIGATQRQYSIRSAGLYNVRVTNIRGCTNTSADIVVTQTQVVVTITPIDSGVRFRATSTPPAQRYQWLRNGVNVPGAIDSIFAPQEEGSYNVRVTDVNGCADTSRTPFQFVIPRVVITPLPPTTIPPSGIPPSSPNVIVRGDTLIAAPGDTVLFGLRLTTIGSLRPGARLTANLCFNATLLEPLPPLTGGTITNGVRCIPVNFVIPQSLDSSALFAPFRAALGNDSTTILLLRDVRLSPNGAPLTTALGNFRLTNISYAGGARLIGPAPRMRLAPGAQNPTSDVAVVKYTLENAVANDNTVPVLPVAITMSDVYGRIVKTSSIQQLLGNVGEIRMDVADLTPGVYFITLRTNNAVSVQRIQVMR